MSMTKDIREPYYSSPLCRTVSIDAFYTVKHLMPQQCD